MQKRSVGFISAVITLICGTEVWSQVVLGRSVVEGRQVELLDNRTWRFVGDLNEASNCITLKEPISFCGRSTDWKRLPHGGDPSIAAEFLLDDRTYGIVIVEGLGTLDGLNFNMYRSLVLQNAAEFLGTSVANIPVLDNFPTQIDGVLADTLVYSGKIEEMSFTYANSVVIDTRYSAQIITYQIGNGFSQSHRAAHNEFVSLIEISD